MALATKRTPAIHINPAKFSIYGFDVSDASDSEFDADEWVSISSASSTPPSSTLPRHLVLRPDTRSRKSILDEAAGVSAAANIGLKGVDLASRPASSYTGDTTGRHHSNDSSNNTGHDPSAISTLKTHLPTLTAIYIVPAIAIQHKQTVTSESIEPFSSFTRPPFSSISLPPVSLYIPSSKECYLQICADCAKPSMTLFCDGSWSSSAAGICSEHAKIMKQTENLHRGTKGRAQALVAWRQPSDCKSESRGDSNRAMVQEDRVRDVELFGSVLEVVQPFERADSEMCGVRVFDMTVPSSTEVYVHRKGCGCGGR